MTEQTLSSQIAEAVRRRIASGELSPGDKLPPVRAMARQWNCTPGTVNRAYTKLASEGLVVGRRGKGTFVTPSFVQPRQSDWNWAGLVHRAEAFLLQALGDGHDPVAVETALSIATARWRDLQASKKTLKQVKTEIENTTLRFAGSHDLAIELLTRLLAERSSMPELVIHFCGSLGGLIALAREETDLAGIHLWDEESNTYNLPFVRRILPGRSATLITLAHRQLGLMLPPGNPEGIHTLYDLKRNGIRFVNRQAGAGTRVWLDVQLRHANIQPESIHGYEREEATHFGVARAISHGEACVGLGIYAAATSQGLDFIPLTKERYDLVIPAEFMERDEIQILMQIMRSPRLKAAIEALGGYDLSEIGSETWLA